MSSTAQAQEELTAHDSRVHSNHNDRVFLLLVRRHPALIETRSRLAQGALFAAAVFMFVAGIGIHFTGSSNTSFLRGQLAQTSLCELESEASNPEARRELHDLISAQFLACMAKSGFTRVADPALCQDATVETNGYRYEPTAWINRAITRVQLAFNWRGVSIMRQSCRECAYCQPPGSCPTANVFRETAVFSA